MKGFWLCDYFLDIYIIYVKIVHTKCCKQFNNKLALVCIILKVNLCENLQKQQNEAPSYFEWKPYSKV